MDVSGFGHYNCFVSFTIKKTKENLKHRVSQIFRGFWSFGKQFKMFENRTRLDHSDYPGMRLLLSCCSSGGLRQPALQLPQA